MTRLLAALVACLICACTTARGPAPAPAPAAEERAGSFFPGGGAGHTVQDETTALTPRAALRFKGAGVVCTDNATDNATECTFSGIPPTGSVGANELASTPVTPGPYGNAQNSPLIVVDQDGRITAALQVPLLPPASQVTLSPSVGGATTAQTALQNLQDTKLAASDAASVSEGAGSPLGSVNCNSPQCFRADTTTGHWWASFTTGTDGWKWLGPNAPVLETAWSSPDGTKTCAEMRSVYGWGADDLKVIDLDTTSGGTEWATCKGDTLVEIAGEPICAVGQKALKIVEGVYACRPNAAAGAEVATDVWIIPGRPSASVDLDIADYLPAAWDYCEGITIPEDAYGPGNPPADVVPAFDHTIEAGTTSRARCAKIDAQPGQMLLTAPILLRANNVNGETPQNTVVDLGALTVHDQLDTDSSGGGYKGTATCGGTAKCIAGTLPTCDVSAAGTWYKVTDVVNPMDPLKGGFSAKTVHAIEKAGSEYDYLGGTRTVYIQTTAAHGLSDGNTTGRRDGLGDRFEIVNATPSTWNGIYHVELVIDEDELIAKWARAAAIPETYTEDTASLQGAATAYCSGIGTPVWASGVPGITFGGWTTDGVNGGTENLRIYPPKIRAKVLDTTNFDTRYIVLDATSGGSPVAGGIENITVDTVVGNGGASATGKTILDVGGPNFLHGSGACKGITVNGGNSDLIGRERGFLVQARCNATLMNLRAAHGGGILVGADISTNAPIVNIVSSNAEGAGDGPALVVLSGTTTVLGGSFNGDVDAGGPNFPDSGFSGVLGGINNDATVNFYGTYLDVAADQDLPFYWQLGRVFFNWYGGRARLGTNDKYSDDSSKTQAGSLFGTHAQSQVKRFNVEHVTQTVTGGTPLLFDSSGGGTLGEIRPNCKATKTFTLFADDAATLAADLCFSTLPGSGPHDCSTATASSDLAHAPWSGGRLWVQDVTIIPQVPANWASGDTATIQVLETNKSGQTPIGSAFTLTDAHTALAVQTFPINAAGSLTAGALQLQVTAVNDPGTDNTLVGPITVRGCVLE